MSDGHYQFSLQILGQHIGSIWADCVTWDRPEDGLRRSVWLSNADGTNVAVLTPRPGITIEQRFGDGAGSVWREVLPPPLPEVNTPDATQSEDCATAQHGAESNYDTLT